MLNVLNTAFDKVDSAVASTLKDIDQMLADTKAIHQKPQMWIWIAIGAVGALTIIGITIIGLCGFKNRHLLSGTRVTEKDLGQMETEILQLRKQLKSLTDRLIEISHILEGDARFREKITTVLESSDN